MLVTGIQRLISSNQRGNHNIEDELVFTKHNGYVFHDSCGFESGGEDELRIVQDFVRERAVSPRLQDRLHAIWSAGLFLRISKLNLVCRFCIPMDNVRPALNSQFFDVICPDKNGVYSIVFICQMKINMKYGVPVIAVFTKYDQFKRDVKIDLLSNSQNASLEDVKNEAENIFQEHYLGVLKDSSTRNVRLESKFWYSLCYHMVACYTL